MTDNDELFLKHLSESEAAVWIVARWLQKQGNGVKINPTGKRPSSKDWEKYVDNGDLEITQRIEVKKLSATFSSREDWPFPNAIVCAKHSYDNAIPKPHAYIYLSKDLKCLAMCMAWTKYLWTVEEKEDRRYNNYRQQFYVADTNCLSFHKLKEEGE